MVSSSLSRPVREHHEELCTDVTLGCYDDRVAPPETWAEVHDMAERQGIDPQSEEYEGLLSTNVAIDSLKKLWQET